MKICCYFLYHLKLHMHNYIPSLRHFPHTQKMSKHITCCETFISETLLAHSYAPAPRIPCTNSEAHSSAAEMQQYNLVLNHSTVHRTL